MYQDEVMVPMGDWKEKRMKKNGFRKGLVCGIIILFIGVSIVPLTGIGAENHCLINDSIGYFNSIRKSEEWSKCHIKWDNG